MHLYIRGIPHPSVYQFLGHRSPSDQTYQLRDVELRACILRFLIFHHHLHTDSILVLLIAFIIFLRRFDFDVIFLPH